MYGPQQAEASDRGAGGSAAAAPASQSGRSRKALGEWILAPVAMDARPSVPMGITEEGIVEAVFRGRNERFVDTYWLQGSKR